MTGAEVVQCCECTDHVENFQRQLLFKLQRKSLYNLEPQAPLLHFMNLPHAQIVLKQTWRQCKPKWNKVSPSLLKTKF